MNINFWIGLAVAGIFGVGAALGIWAAYKLTQNKPDPDSVGRQSYRSSDEDEEFLP